MARTANVETSENGTDAKIKVNRLTADVSFEFDAAMKLWVHKNDITRTSIIRKSVADAIGYEGIVLPDGTHELALVKQSTAHDDAGKKRSASFTATKEKASALDQLKAKLKSGEITTEELVAMLLA